MDIALSAKDIIKAFNGKIKIISYIDIHKYKNIEELLKPYGRTMILYTWKFDKDGGEFGHWCCCFYNKDGDIEFFDSFGEFIDETLKQISKSFKEENNEDFKYLTLLLYNSNHKIIYNDKQLQNNKSNTCGRWCIYRMLRNDIDIDQFQNLFTDNTHKNDKLILKIINF